MYQLTSDDTFVSISSKNSAIYYTRDLPRLRRKRWANIEFFEALEENDFDIRTEIETFKLKTVTLDTPLEKSVISSDSNFNYNEMEKMLQENQAESDPPENKANLVTPKKYLKRYRQECEGEFSNFVMPCYRYAVARYRQKNLKKHTFCEENEVCSRSARIRNGAEGKKKSQPEVKRQSALEIQNQYYQFAKSNIQQKRPLNRSYNINTKYIDADISLTPYNEDKDQKTSYSLFMTELKEAQSKGNSRSGHSNLTDISSLQLYSKDRTSRRDYYTSRSRSPPPTNRTVPSKPIYKGSIGNFVDIRDRSAGELLKQIKQAAKPKTSTNLSTANNKIKQEKAQLEQRRKNAAEKSTGLKAMRFSSRPSNDSPEISRSQSRSVSHTPEIFKVKPRVDTNLMSKLKSNSSANSSSGRSRTNSRSLSVSRGLQSGVSYSPDNSPLTSRPNRNYEKPWNLSTTHSKSNTPERRLETNNVNLPIIFEKKKAKTPTRPHGQSTDTNKAPVGQRPMQNHRRNISQLYTRNHSPIPSQPNSANRQSEIFLVENAAAHPQTELIIRSRDDKTPSSHREIIPKRPNGQKVLLKRPEKVHAFISSRTSTKVSFEQPNIRNQQKKVAQPTIIELDINITKSTISDMHERTRNITKPPHIKDISPYKY